jgi:hypothetical protein
MKKTLWILMAGALAASVIAASAQEVLSQNAVGYIKKTLPAGGKLVMMSIPLDSMTEENIVFGRTSVAQEAVQNSTVYFWDTTLQTWSFGLKGIKGWGPPVEQGGRGGRSLLPEGPCCGSRPGCDDHRRSAGRSHPAPPFRAASALGTLGNPYPVDFKFGESALANNASQNSTVYFWDEALQTWALALKGIKGWGPVQSNKVVRRAKASS